MYLKEQIPGFTTPDDSIHPGKLLHTNIKTNHSFFFIRSKQVLKQKLRLHSLTGLLIILLLPFSKARGQHEIDYAIHANIIYHFTKYINWPDNKKTGDFIIGIVGDTPLYEELQKLTANKMVGNQKIIIKKFPSSETIFNCHILFISESKSKSVKNIVPATKNSSTLIVSESDGLAAKGSCINIVIVREHLKLEINKINIEQRGLSIATELLSLGVIVK